MTHDAVAHDGGVDGGPPGVEVDPDAHEQAIERRGGVDGMLVPTVQHHVVVDELHIARAELDVETMLVRDLDSNILLPLSPDKASTEKLRPNLKDPSKLQRYGLRWAARASPPR